MDEVIINGNNSSEEAVGNVSYQIGLNNEFTSSLFGDKLEIKTYTEVKAGKIGDVEVNTTYFNGRAESVSVTRGFIGVSVDVDGNVFSTVNFMGITIGAPIMSTDPSLSIDIKRSFYNTPVYNGVNINYRPGGISMMGLAPFLFGIPSVMSGFIPPLLAPGY